MFAVVSIGGFQEMVKEGDTLDIPLQDAEENKTIVFGDVLMVSKDGGELMIGAPFLKDVSVEVKVLKHGRGDKIRVVKFRRRKRFARVKGHRQHHTSVQVMKIKI